MMDWREAESRVDNSLCIRRFAILALSGTFLQTFEEQKERLTKSWLMMYKIERDRMEEAIVSSVTVSKCDQPEDAEDTKGFYKVLRVTPDTECRYLCRDGRKLAFCGAAGLLVGMHVF